MPSCSSLSLCPFPPHNSLTIRHTWPTSWRCAGDPQRRRVWTCPGNVRVVRMSVPLTSQTLLGLLPGASSTVWALKCQEMLYDVVWCHRAPWSGPLTLQRGYKPGSVPRWKKTGHRANVPSSGGGLGIPRCNQAVHQKGYFCTF